MDRRVTPMTSRVAHLSMRGQAGDLPLTEGVIENVVHSLVDLRSNPFGARERQLPFGTEFCVIDRDQGHAFGFVRRDGYCGWLAQDALGHAPPPTHWVSSTGTHLYPAPRVQSPEVMALPMGSQVTVIGFDKGFAQTPQGFIPQSHLFEIGQFRSDFAAVAAEFLGAPYLWGGNSRAGLDCSGLVQMSLHACGIAAQGDSDLQQVLGHEIASGDALIRNDLVFWRGHVAIVVDETTLIHANGYTMSVAYEQIAPSMARIAAQGGGPVTHRRRLI
jgi:cell wall-associated NlpC family hydrolase